MTVGLAEGVGVDDICTMTMGVRVDNGETMRQHYNQRGSGVDDNCNERQVQQHQQVMAMMSQSQRAADKIVKATTMMTG